MECHSDRKVKNIVCVVRYSILAHSKVTGRSVSAVGSIQRVLLGCGGSLRDGQRYELHCHLFCLGRGGHRLMENQKSGRCFCMISL